MKFSGVLLGILAAAVPGAGAAPPESDPPATYAPAELAEAWGRITALRQKVDGAGLSEAERAVFLAGAAAELRGGTGPADLRRIFPDVQKLAAARREARTRALAAEQRARAAAFFAGFSARPGVTVLPGGLAYEVLRAGRGPAPRPRQTVRVHYTGRLLDGTEFVQLGPYEVVLVPNRLSPALFRGLQEVGPGGSIRLYVPPGAAGDEASLGLPPGAGTVFEIEVFEVRDTAPEDLANSLLPPAPEPPPPPPSGRPERELIAAWGWLTARSTDAAAFHLSPDEAAGFVRGLAAGIGDAPVPGDWTRRERALGIFLSSRRAALRQAALDQRRAAMDTLFVQLDRNPAVVRLPDGLRYEVVRPGRGPFPHPGQVVRVNYTGRLLDGTVFDRTDNEPLHVEVGSVIAGWNEGIQRINPGGRLKLYVPPELGYGQENRSGVIASIPAGSALIYEIELLGIEDALPEPRTGP